MKINILYFARFRDELGIASEQIELPQEVTTLSTLCDWLRDQDEKKAAIFAADRKILMSINQAMAHLEQTLNDGDEVAFFPPVTGG